MSRIDYVEGDWKSCWQCFGDGGWHDCGDDCCMCLDKESITVICDECLGEGQQFFPYESTDARSDR